MKKRMRRRSLFRRGMVGPGLLMVVLLSAGCSGLRARNFPPDPVMMTAEDTPDSFLVGVPNSDETMEPRPNEGCRNPMVDPRDGTRLRLVRSVEDRGDYEVPPERYGVELDELLRLECSTGEVIGIVPR